MIDKPKQGEDVRLLHRHVTELVKGTNALMNMRATMQGRISGAGVLRFFGNNAELRIETGDPGAPAILGGAGKKSTVCNIISSNNPAEYGSSVHWTGSVAPDATGTIAFTIDGAAWGGPVTVIGGVANSAAKTNLSSGNHIVQAHYSGSAVYKDASAQLTQTVQGLNKPLVAAFGSPNPSLKGIDFVIFGANVTPQNPIPPAPALTGQVRFFVDGSNFSTRPLSLLSGQTWRAMTDNDPINYLDQGDHNVQAIYLGDNHYGQASDIYVQHVGASAKVVASATPNPALPTQAVTFRATVSPTYGGGGNPTGWVQFYVDNVAYGGQIPLVNGAAAIGHAAFPTVAEYDVRALYGGDGTYQSAWSNIVTLTVTEVAGFDVSTPYGWATGPTVSIQYMHLANHGAGTSMARLAVLDSHASLFDTQGNIVYNGPVIYSWSNPNYQLTPFDVNLQLQWVSTIGSAWFKFQVQYSTGQYENRLYVPFPTANFYADAGYVFGNMPG